ncbi:RdgB/HAM1 family non-canonical purine NTP pyrophosphatase [Bacteroidia bacterium]|nr:RdgB/HAM1 family non-canonical purine NTP pyrophosphatase [Bacteroidia bacterium]MDB4106892.1 RdgB/HAM1 family non-canonical purine NTP pyrophosphatase [Bacteroidia bacterium]MDB9882553.1 RdgB/HAM1 family non-canonical purine NTP pyrophosphatase [Bacteroidia bacterium]
MNIIFASQNPNKIAEIRAKLPGHTIDGLDPNLFPDELLETGLTLDANALQKVRQVYEKTAENCFADDTGLEVESLDGEPGVYSARYAGEQKNSEDNMALLLNKLEGLSNRNARFRTVVALVWKGQEYIFEGICKGHIITQKSGSKGFGYDPIFIPEGYDRTFAEMTMEEKSQISHRGLAVEKLVQFLSELND